MNESYTAQTKQGNKERTRDDIDEEIAKLRKDIASLTATLKEIATNAAGIATNTVRDRMGKASDEVHSAFDTTTATARRAVNEHPLTTLLMALGLGFLLGQILRR